MLPKESLKDLLSQPELSKTDKLLICLAVDSATSRPVKDIVDLAYSAGFRAVRKLNVSNDLKRAGPLAIRTEAGWELTAAGSKHVARIAGPLMNSPLPQVASSLRTHLIKITDSQTQSFVEEAISCFEARLYRAAVVLSWAGAVSVLYGHICKHELVAFNAEAVRRDNKWKAAKNADDIGRMREFDFLQILDALSIIGKNVKQQLEHSLKLRNGCAHPNSLQIAEHVVSAHIELLILNVFANPKFS